MAKETIDLSSQVALVGDGMRYKLILWDFDGTLADTRASSLRIYNALAARHGLRTVEDPESIRGMTTHTLLRHLGVPLLSLPSLVLEFLAAQREQIEQVRLFPGIPAVLDELRNAGCRQAVLSSNSAENISTCLRANGAEAFFEAVVGYRRLLGKGRGIRRYLRAQAASAGDAVYVGDEVRDVEAARRAGVDIVAVSWGFNRRDVLAEHRPDYLIDRPEQLPGLLRG